MRCGNYVIYVCVWWVVSRSCGLYLNKTIFRQKKFTLSPCPQGNYCKAEEKRGKLWRVTRMWPGRKEDDKLYYFMWENESEREHPCKEESFIKWVKWLLPSALTTTDLLLAVALACIMMWSSNSSWWFHLLPTTPSEQTRDLDVAMKQCRYDMMKDSSIGISFGSEFCFVS